ncbi:formate/nitrite transporter family protein [Arthrobacter sp.]|uniref:formate/nitrite transporter family protein n=1 Tax=Arthrobacter sp. TaxID=1667 RepID=UPI003A8E181C
MSYVHPVHVIEAAAAAGKDKATAGAVPLVMRGVLGGAILACATTLAMGASLETSPIFGAVIFPIGFVVIVLLGLELVTGGFALIPLAVYRRDVSVASMLRNYVLVIVGHLIGCIGYAAAYVAVITRMGTSSGHPMVAALVDLATAKTLGYESLGGAGFALVFIKAILCNWMVTLGVVMALTSTSTGGKIAAMWLPVTCFFAQGFEHAVVNMFVIPAGMMLGAPVSVGQWWVWNQGPVLLGNFVGGLVLTAAGLCIAHLKKRPAAGGELEDELEQLAATHRGASKI